MTLKIKVILTLLIILALGLVIGAFSFYRALNLPNSDSSESAIVEVKSGTVEDVGNILQDKKILQTPLIFMLYSRLSGKQIFAGYYKLPKNLSPKETFDALTNDKYRVYKVTIPEGYRMEQIGQKLTENEITDYEDFISLAKGMEGRLFPDTYFFSKNMDSKEVVRVLTDNFTKKTSGLNLRESDLILASIVERETSGDDRNIIAGVYKNRLNIGMKLDADPTVQYAKDTNSINKLNNVSILEFKFWKTITSKDYYSVESDYNTYLNSTLPPGPICNPGLLSIQAALNPDKNEYIYFFHSDGEIYPSKTIQEHNEKKQKYLYK